MGYSSIVRRLYAQRNSAHKPTISPRSECPGDGCTLRPRDCNCSEHHKCGLRPDSRYLAKGGHRDDTGYAAMRQLLGVRPLTDGVFCFNDPVAIGAIKAILEAGLKLPHDISVVGAGNVHYSDLLAVPLTTVDQGPCRMGVWAAELLLERIAPKNSMRPRKILILPKLVERESTRRQP